MGQNVATLFGAKNPEAGADDDDLAAHRGGRQARDCCPASRSRP